MKKILCFMFLIFVTLGFSSFGVSANNGYSVFINEVEYDPDGPQNKSEWLELVNSGNSEVDLTNWTLSEKTSSGVNTYTFSGGKISSKGFFLIVNETQDFQNMYPGVVPDLDLPGLQKLRLSNGNDYLELKDASGNLVDRVEWGKSPDWNISASDKPLCRKNAFPFNITDTDTSSDWYSAPCDATPGKLNIPKQPPVLNTIDKTILVGTSLNLLDLVTSATDQEDGNIKSSVIVKDNGGFDNATPGTYTITYEVTDSDGNIVTATSTVTVSSNNVPVLNTIDKTILVGTSLNLLDLVTSVTDQEDGNIKSSVIVKDNGGFDNTTPGTYTITYEVTDSDGNTVTATSVVTVKQRSSNGGTTNNIRGSACSNCFDIEDDPNVSIETPEETNKNSPSKNIDDKSDSKKDNPIKVDDKTNNTQIEKEKIKKELDITDKELHNLIIIENKEALKEKIKEYIIRKRKKNFTPIGPIHVLNGETEIKKYPTILPQTGEQEDIYKKVGKTTASIVTKLDISLPKEESFEMKGSSDKKLSSWLQTLPEVDRSGDKYIVIPSKGLIMPINTVTKQAPIYTRFINGSNENFHKYLETGAVEIPGTSTKTYGEVGNKVIAGHSSFWKNNKGRYKTHFQKIIDIQPGEEIWIYEKQKNKNMFDRYVYKIKKSYNTDKTDISILYPTNTKTLTLFTCTPIGGVSGRWIVRAELIN